jgi:hypothetical protein
LNRSVELISETIKTWTGSAPAVVTIDETNRDLASDQAIVFTTLEKLKQIAPKFVAAYSELEKTKSADEQGFLFVPLTINGAKQLFVVSQTARGVFNGAVYLRDFCIDGEKENLSADFRPFSRSPEFKGRPAYVLTIWGHEAQYSPDDWDKIFDRFARDGLDRVYFWVCGHFPSKLYPQVYGREYAWEETTIPNTTKDSRIGSVEALKKVIAYAHKRGLKIYLGGAFGGWTGSMFLTDMDPTTFKVGPKEPSLCPSNKRAHEAMHKYYVEIFTALPEADGVFIESTDEYGECQCADCSRKLDDLGSKQFGQTQLDLCEKIMKDVWKIKPEAKFAYTIGYPEHKSDVLYYERIKKLSTDPRFEWMEARRNWTFPGPKGEQLPNAYFSDKVMHWKQNYWKPLSDLINDAQRAKKEKCYGLITSFEPGYATGSFYTQIPFPTDLLPYALTGFVFREVTWNPSYTVADMQERTHQRFFGKESPKGLADDLWKLREIIRSKKGTNQLSAIEQRIKDARTKASPKTTQGLDLMTRAIDDIRKYGLSKVR